MILLLGGTADGRTAAEKIAAKGHKIIYSSISSYNAPFPSLRLIWHRGAMDQKGLVEFIGENDIDLLIDATHPYAKQASENAMAAAAECGIRYVRLERPGISSFGDAQDVIRCDSYETAVEYLNNHPGNILSTTGSRELERYEPVDKSRLYIRVLPTSSIIAKCEELGYKPSHIIAMQGPFTRAMNCAMIDALNIRYITTKDSGDIGGVREKIEAAKDCGAIVLCIDRPSVDYPEICSTPDSLIQYLDL